VTGTRIRWFVLASALFGVLLLASAPGAFAYNEYNAYPANPSPLGNHAPCFDCHGAKYPGAGGENCLLCHGPNTGAYMGQGNGKGPHGLYTATADRCDSCHTIHDAPTDNALLPAATNTATCFICHDGTGGHGVYGTIAARGGSVGASHSIDTTDGANVIPGGSWASGGDRTQAFTGAGGKMGCNDCHSPHDTNTVNEFAGDRQRTTVLWMNHNETSNKLLKQRPTGATTATLEYGSDWCAGCHNGRTSGGMVLNHPVDSTISRPNPADPPFTYSEVALLASADTTTSSTILGPLGGWNRPPHIPVMHGSPEPPDDYGMNRGYLMPYPRTAQQGDHYPICQQCHEDSRNAGNLSADGSEARSAPMVITAEDGAASTDNPRYQNFPHETVNRRMLVENNDDLCMNCHPPAVLP
jgi:predicted CXXCH cytochrome family protein